MLAENLLHKFAEVNILPYNPRAVQPASIDLHLGYVFRAPSAPVSHSDGSLRLREHVPGKITRLPDSGPAEYILEPHTTVLAETLETVSVPRVFAAEVRGKSSWARLFLGVEDAGFVDPGFEGTLTLELRNHSEHPIALKPGTPICQIAVHALEGIVLTPYGPERGSHYFGQWGARGAAVGDGGKRKTGTVDDPPYPYFSVEGDGVSSVRRVDAIPRIIGEGGIDV